MPLWIAKNCGIFVTKLRNLHIKDGLNYVMKEKQLINRSEWFRGYRCFDSKKVVLDRFNTGQVLSCFVLNHNYDEVHVAYGDNAARRGGADALAFASFTYSTHTHFAVRNQGFNFAGLPALKSLPLQKRRN